MNSAQGKMIIYEVLAARISCLAMITASGSEQEQNGWPIENKLVCEKASTS